MWALINAVQTRGRSLMTWQDEASEEKCALPHDHKRVSSDSCYMVTPHFHVYVSIWGLSTSVLALGVIFPGVAVGALPPAVVPLPVALPVAVVTTTDFEAMADPGDSFCNAPKSSTFKRLIGNLTILCDKCNTHKCQFTYGIICLQFWNATSLEAKVSNERTLLGFRDDTFAPVSVNNWLVYYLTGNWRYINLFFTSDLEFNQ